MLTVPHLASDLQSLLTLQAERIGRDTGLIQRRRAFSAPTLAQVLILGWLQNPEATLSELASLAAFLDTDVTQQALQQRFTPLCAEFLLSLLVCACQLSVGATHTPDALAQFPAVFLVDSSVVMLPKALCEIWRGCGGNRGANAGLKLHTGFDLTNGRLSLALTDAKVHDARSSLAAHPLEPGSLRIADLGYFQFAQMQAYHAQGVFWLSRLKADAIWHSEAGERVALVEVLAQASEPSVVFTGFLGKARLPARLLAYRVSPEDARRRRAQVKARSRRKSRPPSRQRLALSGWTLLVTNAPDLSLAAAYELYRIRWQIEVLFKQWKLHGQLASWRSENPWRILCEVYAKLIGLLIQHWLCLEALWSDLRRSLVKAGREVRKHTLFLAQALRDGLPLEAVLAEIPRSLGKAVRTDRRHSQPAAWQCLLAALT